MREFVHLVLLEKTLWLWGREQMRRINAWILHCPGGVMSCVQINYLNCLKACLEWVSSPRMICVSLVSLLQWWRHRATDSLFLRCCLWDKFLFHQKGHPRITHRKIMLGFFVGRSILASWAWAIFWIEISGFHIRKEGTWQKRMGTLGYWKITNSVLIWKGWWS